MKRNFFLAALIAIFTFALCSFAHAGSVTFSDDFKDYQLFTPVTDDTAQWVFYGIVEGDATQDKIDDIILNYAALTPLYENGELVEHIHNLDANNDKIEFEIELDKCELLGEAHGGLGFRCFGLEFDTDETSVLESVGFLSIDFSHLRFELDGETSEWLWGRPFQMDVMCTLYANDDDEDNDCIYNVDDADGDSVPNYIDNCVDEDNFDQKDGDGDGIGDICDSCEGAEDTGVDSDYDGVDDACDPCPYDNSDTCDAATDDGVDDVVVEDDEGEDDDIDDYGEITDLDFGGDSDISGGASADEAEGFVSGCVLAQGTTSSINLFGVILIAVGLLQIVGVRRKR